MPHARARWIDENGRSHEWSGEVASNDRNQIKSQIYAQTNARDVIISTVTPGSSSSYDDNRRRHIEEENRRRQERIDEMKSGGNYTSNTSNYSSPSRYESDNSYSGSSSMDTSSILALIAVAGGIWAFVTFLPWVLMLLYGSGGTWVSEKLTGQSVVDYTEEENPSESMTKKAMTTLVVALICGGIGFIQGSGWQHDWNKYSNTQPQKVEQVNQK